MSTAPIDALFHAMAAAGASDLHLSVDSPPIIRKDGRLQPLDPAAPPLAISDWRALLKPIMPEKNRAEFDARHDTDFAYEIPGLARFRANVFADRKGPGAVFRVIPTKILTAEQLGLSSHILALCQLNKGLVLVTGPTGSGKSTTLCAMIDHINQTRHDHIITIEDPIEFVHPNKKCLINQREVGTHTDSFRDALRAALREDPDIILVGELRDLETVAIAIETAETGHLVFGTLHTTTAASTIDRVIDQFPADRQAQIRIMLSESLRGVIAQTLCRKIGGGRVAALEVLIVTGAISNLIREGKTFQIPSMMQVGKAVGMVSLNEALLDLVVKKLVAPEEAYSQGRRQAGLRVGAQARRRHPRRAPENPADACLRAALRFLGHRAQPRHEPRAEASKPAARFDDRMNVLDRSSGSDATLRQNSVPLAILLQVLLDIRKVERRDGRAARLQIRAHRANRLRPAEVADDRDDEIPRLEVLHDGEPRLAGEVALVRAGCVGCES